MTVKKKVAKKKVVTNKNVVTVKHVNNPRICLTDACWKNGDTDEWIVAVPDDDFDRGMENFKEKDLFVEITAPCGDHAYIRQGLWEELKKAIDQNFLIQKQGDK